MKSWSSLVSIRYNVPSLIISAASTWTVVVQFVEKYASWITEPPERVLGGWKIPESKSLVVWNSPNQSPMKKDVYILSIHIGHRGIESFVGWQTCVEYVMRCYKLAEALQCPLKSALPPKAPRCSRGQSWRLPPALKDWVPTRTGTSDNF